jgi:hypothetical protein
MAIPGTTTTTTSVKTSPFKQDELRAKADQWLKLKFDAGKVPYMIVAFSPILEDQDVTTHSEPFDVDAETPDPSVGRYATDSAALAAVNDRFSSLKGNMAPYIYIAAGGNGVRFQDYWQPPKLREKIVSTTVSSVPLIAKVGLGLAGAFGVLALFGKSK